jgi:hypothetical protein
MASEADTRKLVIERMRQAGFDPVAVENSVHMGTPDVNYTHGWIELKILDEWPKRESTAVKIRHYTQQQKTWAIRRRAAGGTVWFLLRVGNCEWLLMAGATAAFVVGRANREQLISASVLHCKKNMQWDKFAEILRRAADAT